MRVKEEHLPILFKVAVLDLYDGAANQGMRCICEILDEFGRAAGIELSYQIFDVRGKAQVPDLSFDAYISTGGPGSPIDSVGSEWEERFFKFTDDLREYNKDNQHALKYLFLICHSFQLYNRYYGFGTVTQRLSTSFGVMPVHMNFSAAYEPFFEGLEDPFYVVDSRDWQVVQPDMKKLRSQGGEVLCIEKYRPHVKLERCIMAMRFDRATFGTQFHPEADAVGMLVHLSEAEKRQQVIDNHGEEKYNSMIEHLNDEDKIVLTHDTILPKFLETALREKLLIHTN
jgi:homoserine O-succinyltransferase/O-acetyltransferase